MKSGYQYFVVMLIFVGLVVSCGGEDGGVTEIVETAQVAVEEELDFGATAVTDLNLDVSVPLIVFNSTRDGNFEIYTMLPNRSEVNNLTNHPAEDVMPSWSGDGKHIVFVSDRAGDYNLYVMAADGSGLRQLTDDVGADIMPHWSPQGDRIAFTSERNGKTEIYTIMSDGSDLRQISGEGLHEEMAPRWSPDGAAILFLADRDVLSESEDGGNPVLYMMKADGSDIELIDSESNYYTPAAWSPDGRKIVYGAQEGDFFDLFILDMETKERVHFLSYSSRDIWPSWSPDGTRLAFTSLYTSNPEIYVVDLVSGDVEQLTDNVDQVNSLPEWQPVGGGGE
ncbi:MAG TPA: DPP IV N-terminal domain-containing protein [Anaerolineae bacterium]|nr:DPP IV N-terminal domain-containing protein [Anaerolineae bacterium]